MAGYSCLDNSIMQLGCPIIPKDAMLEGEEDMYSGRVSVHVVEKAMAQGLGADEEGIYLFQPPSGSAPILTSSY